MLFYTITVSSISEGTRCASITCFGEIDGSTTKPLDGYNRVAALAVQKLKEDNPAMISRPFVIDNYHVEENHLDAGD